MRNVQLQSKQAVAIALMMLNKVRALVEIRNPERFAVDVNQVSVATPSSYYPLDGYFTAVLNGDSINVWVVGILIYSVRRTSCRAAEIRVLRPIKSNKSQTR